MKEEKKLEKERYNSLRGIKYFVLVVLGTLTSLWRAALSTLYLVVYSFLLFALMIYFREIIVVPVALGPFLNLINVLVDNWLIFFMAFFLTNLYDKWRWK